MVIKTASPGVFIQEVDLTRGSADAITENVGVVAGPFEKGPVDQLVYITTELELRQTFGEPTDENFEYWHSINNFLEYSGNCYVVRCDDAVGDVVDEGANTVNAQKMRNATDAFTYYDDSLPMPNPNDPTQTERTQSSVYVKNEDEFLVEKNASQPGLGKFFGRTPGRWANGIGIAVIDKGADYQMTLKSTDVSLSTDNQIILDGGSSVISPTDILDGNTNQQEEGATSQIALTNLRATDDSTVPPFSADTEVGRGIGRYIKIQFEAKPDLEDVTELLIDPGDDNINFVADDGSDTGLLSGQETVTDGNGQSLVLDLTLSGGSVIAVAVNNQGASSSQGYKEGDTVTVSRVQNSGFVSTVTMTVTGVSEVLGTIVTFGDGGTEALVAAVVRLEEINDVWFATCVVREDVGQGGYGELDQYEDLDGTLTVSNAPGIEIGQATAIYVLGDFLYYSKSANQIVNSIFEEKTYTRNQGISWYWPARAADGEKVFSGKLARDAAGDAIEGEDSTPSNPTFQRLQGPAIVTSPTVDPIYWDARRELWIQTYVPRNNDILIEPDPKDENGGTVYDPATGAPVRGNLYYVQGTRDWYTQQIAFEGIPWINFAKRPGTSANALDQGTIDDEMHIVVYDALGEVTGVRGSTLEQYISVSKLKGAKTLEGTNNYYKDLINRSSLLIFSNDRVESIGEGSTGDITGLLNSGRVAPGTLLSVNQKATFLRPRYGAVDLAETNLFAEDTPDSLKVRDIPYILLGGEDQLSASLGEIQAGYKKIEEENVSDLDYIIQGPAYDMMQFGDGTYDEQLNAAVGKGNYLIALGEKLKTAMVLLSPPRSAAVEPINAGRITNRVIDWADRLSSSTYAVLDSGYKYMYDRFSDKYRYVPLNADIAGTMAQTSLVSEPFFSPAGLSRGQIKNVVKLSYDPSKEQRDLLFSSRVNPVVTFPGEGTVLYGDKTAVAYTSAFSRINVRRLFIYMEREIAKISRNVLFEFNDVPTRTNFLNNTNPFLRDIQSKRGVIDFLVICDSTNNTPEVIDRNEFVADIYVKPNRSINFVQLSFVATKTGVSFSEAIGLNRRFESLQ